MSSGGLPETPAAMTAVLLMACLAAALDSGSEPRIARLLDLVAQCRQALDGERPVRESRVQ
jgi:hypothetical protein